MNVIKRIFFVFICFTFHIGTGLAATEQKALEALPLCKSERCFVTAKPMPWPAFTAQEVIKVKYKQLSLSLPKNIDYVGIADTVTVFSYGKKNILIGSITKDDFNLPESDISFLEGFEITFTKTPEDKEPDSIRNKLVWRIMLLSKEDMFNKADRICVYKNNDFTVYFISGLSGPYKNTAYIVRQKFDNSIVVLQSDIDIDKFLEIVASIK
jgi:hypothetical protein